GFGTKRPTIARQARHGPTHTLELSSYWRSERKESTCQEHDHVQCVPKWLLSLTFARGQRVPQDACQAALAARIIQETAPTSRGVQHRSAAATAHPTDCNQPLPPSTNS